MLLESIQRICNNTLEDFANELISKFDVVWTSDFCSCNVGLVGMRGPHCRSRTCSHMLHQVTIVFPSSVKTGRSPSSSTPTIVAFVPPGMTSWHDDTTCKKVQAPNPIHALHESLGNHKFRHLHVPGRARACQGVCEPHSALRLRSPTNIGHSATHREYVEIVLHAPVYHSTVTCRSVLLRRTPTTKHGNMHRA